MEVNILRQFAKQLETEVKGRRLDIPQSFGSGYCIEYVFNRYIRMLISNYQLKEDLEIANPFVGNSKRIIFFKFQNMFPKEEHTPSETPLVLVATSRINTEELLSIHSNTATINIEVEVDYLDEVFKLSDKSLILQSLLKEDQPLLFEQMVYPSLQRIVYEILNEEIDESFKIPLLRIKAEELICRLLMELEKREEVHLYPLNTADIQTLYEIKAQILKHLDTPPLIKNLSKEANMSITKLQRLFRQVFGDSIFSYYQTFRIKEAARLLREEKLSVSEVGYQLGFTNLSHFSRVFAEHIGVKPKQYTKMK